jgi:hypothetical protein
VKGVTMGDDGLRRAGFDPVKVRLLEKTADGYRPEHVWVERLSPCHGVVLNPTMYDHGIEFSDVVLFDMAPIGEATFQGRPVPRFPLLQKLRAGAARSFKVTLTEWTAGRVEELTKSLPDGVGVYLFDEKVRWICAECIRTGEPHREEHEAKNATESRIRAGKLVCQPSVNAEEGRAIFEATVQRIGGIGVEVLKS